MGKSLAVLALAALCISGCAVEDHGPGIRIWNRTHARISVMYLQPDGTKNVAFGSIDVDPGMEIRDTAAFRASGNNLGCVPGTFVAQQSGRPISFLHAPCEGTVWEVGEPSPS